MKVNSGYLRSVMAFRGISNKELSKESGISATNISHIRNGKSCRYETIKRIADALSISVDELISESKNENV